MKKLVFALLIFVMSVVPSFAAGEATEAKEEEKAVVNGAYEVANYDFEATVTKEHAYEVTEKITVNLPDAVQKIDFAIPNGNFRMIGLKVENANYEAKASGSGNLVSIVDPDKLTAGQHTYTISYTIREFADGDSSKDILYFDVLLPGWTQPITNVNIKVQLPMDFPWDGLEYYAGQYGVQNVDTKLNYKADETNHIVTITGERIPENFGITLKSNLENGYWEGALDGKWATELMVILSAVAALILFVLWMIGGRDPKIAKVKQTKPIEGITPVEMGYIFVGRVRMRDIIAMIVDLGIKGYLKISEYAPKKYNIIRLQDPSSEEKFIRNAYDILFEEIPQNRGVDISELGPRLIRIKKSIGEDVAAGFSSDDMLAYTPISRVLRKISTVLLAIMIGFTCALRYSYVFNSANWIEVIIVTVLAGVFLTMLCDQFDKYYYEEKKYFMIRLITQTVAFAAVPIYVAVRTVVLTGQWFAALATLVLTLAGAFLVVIMRARAKGNAALTNRFMQLKHHIYHPEAKDIAENAFADINYYYDIVPYALLFNGLETWAISFASLDVPAPEWYSDDIEGNAISNLRTETETVVDYARDIKAFARTLEDNYHALDSRRNKK